MRDNFSQKIKDILAKRVAWKCSFPGCQRPTVGPGNSNNEDVINLGEASHIFAASPGGPRYDDTMSREQRSSIDNGIWLCKSHARIIDIDYVNYSPETIKQWKLIAERTSFELLENLEEEKVILPTTLVAIGSNILIEAIWKSANDGIWEFEIVKFVLGEFDNILSFNDNKSKLEKYIIIESQGDGRLISGDLNWQLIDNKHIISLATLEKSKRTTPYRLTDISADFQFEDGDFKFVTGEDAAKQAIMIALSTNFGDMKDSPLFGSFFSYYYWKFKDDIFNLTRVIKLEITRLVSIPYQDRLSGDYTPPLDFINRILKVDILEINVIDSKIPVKIALEWGDGKHWESVIEIYIGELERFNIF